MTQASTMDTQKQLRMGRIRRSVDGAVRHLVLIGLSVVWLVPILWLLVTSLSTYAGINFRTFFPDHYTFQNYIDILFHSDSVAQFPRWFMNTLVVACFNCVISTAFVVMVAYAMSCCKFKSRRLLQNLLNNAVRYGRPDGHILVTLRREGADAVLSVRDDGPGIPYNQQDKIWQRFYQADASRSGENGAGLGLPMVRQIAALHGGTVTLDSAPGKGSCFTFRFPAERP